jgi:hypothetical protein
MGRKCKNLQDCQGYDDFARYANMHGAEIEHGGRHDIVKTGQGIAPLPRHTGDYKKGTAAAIRRQFRNIGLAIFIIGLAAYALIQLV